VVHHATLHFRGHLKHFTNRFFRQSINTRVITRIIREYHYACQKQKNDRTVKRRRKRNDMGQTRKPVNSVVNTRTGMRSPGDEKQIAHIWKHLDPKIPNCSESLKGSLPFQTWSSRQARCSTCGSSGEAQAALNLKAFRLGHSLLFQTLIIKNLWAVFEKGKW
jgi:hypothetical protein